MIDNDQGQCELMKIIIKRRELEAKQDDLDRRERDKETASENMARGGHLYRIIQKFESGEGINQDEDESDAPPPVPEIPVQTGHVPALRSFLFSQHSQPSRESGSSVNSHLSRYSPGKKTDSFSSISGDSISSSESSSAYSKNTQRSYLDPKCKNSQPLTSANSSESNTSFLWKTSEKPKGFVFVEGKTTLDDHSDASSVAEEADYYSLNESDDNNNPSDNLIKSMNSVHIYEPAPYLLSDYKDRGSGEENIYECINYSSASSAVPDSDRFDSSTVASDEYGSEHYEDINNYAPVIVSAINHQFSTSDGPPTDHALPETKADKYLRKCRERLYELIHTESLYVGKLRHIVRDYVPLLKGDLGPPSLAGMPPEAVFSNITQLYKFHSRELLPALQDANYDLMRIGKIFRQYENRFMMYIKYSRNNKKCTRHVFENKLFFKQKQMEVGKRLDLSSYLLEPIQRMPRYLLFLDELVKTRVLYDEEVKSNCRDSVISSSSSATYENIPENYAAELETPLQSLQAARAMMKGLLRKIDNTIAIENIKDCPIDLLNEGELLKQDEFHVMDSYKKRYLMRCFLFENCLIFTIVSRKQLKEEIFFYHDIIRMGDLGITPPEDDSATSFCLWYRKRTIKPYVMEAEPAIRRAWVNEITDLLWKQAVKDKEKLQASKRYSTVSIASSSKESSIASTSKESSIASTSKDTSSIASAPKDWLPVAKEPAIAEVAGPTHLTGDQYSSLRGVPGEIRKIKRKRLRTTWYVE